MIYADSGVNIYSQKVLRTLKLAAIAPCNFHATSQQHSCIAASSSMPLMLEFSKLNWDSVASQK